MKNLRIAHAATMPHSEETLVVTFSRKLTHSEVRFLHDVLSRAVAMNIGPKLPELKVV